MATPFGIAYGIGAGLAGVPQAYMQGVGADQQLQAREMEMARQQEAMQRAQLVDQEISAAVKEGGDIYGKLMSRFADKGLGQEAIKILEPYQKQKQMQNALELEDAGRALAYGDSTPIVNYLNKRDINVRGIKLAQDGQTVDITTPDNRTVTMPTTDALAFLHEGKAMPNLLKLADQQEAARAKMAAQEAERKRKSGEFATMMQYRYDALKASLNRAKLGAAAGSKVLQLIEAAAPQIAAQTGRPVEEVKANAYQMALGLVPKAGQQATLGLGKQKLAQGLVKMQGEGTLITQEVINSAKDPEEKKMLEGLQRLQSNIQNYLTETPQPRQTTQNVLPMARAGEEVRESGGKRYVKRDGAVIEVR